MTCGNSQPLATLPGTPLPSYLSDLLSETLTSCGGHWASTVPWTGWGTFFIHTGSWVRSSTPVAQPRGKNVLLSANLSFQLKTTSLQKSLLPGHCALDRHLGPTCSAHT
jgi:hypothetical protein